MKRLSTVAAVASILPMRCGAQGVPERPSSALPLRGDTIFDERVSRTPTELRGDFRDTLQGARVSYTTTLDAAGVIIRLEV